MEAELKKRDGESRVQYIYRLASMKDSGELDITWDELAEIFNDQLGCNYGSSAYRKPYTQAMEFYNEVFSNYDTPSFLNEMRVAKQELYKERTRLRDERNQLNKQLREEARMDAFIDEIKNSLAEQFPIRVRKCETKGDVATEAIVCLSDMHVGVTTDNHMNVYDVSVMQERLDAYLDEIRNIQKRHNAGVCYLCLLGDQISGSIHASITATNSINTVQQIQVACMAISRFVEELSEIFEDIYIFNISGNHSRTNPNKEDNIPGDNLDSLIGFYLDAATRGNKRITVCKNTDGSYGYSQRFFTISGREVVIVHGDQDSPKHVVDNMIQLYGSVPDIILMGHMHHSAFNTIGKTRVIQCGCLCGVEGYAFNKRLFAPVEQTVVITSCRKTIECLYNVSLEDEAVPMPFEE